MIDVLYFAWVREAVGVSADRVEAAPTVGALVDRLEARGGGYAEVLRDRSRLRYAVNQAFVGAEAELRDGDEVAIFPPVTGG